MTLATGVDSIALNSPGLTQSQDFCSLHPSHPIRADGICVLVATFLEGSSLPSLVSQRLTPNNEEFKDSCNVLSQKVASNVK